MTSDLIEPTTIRNCVDVEELWSHIVGSKSGGRSLWLGFLDADSTVLPTLVPFDDFPALPDRPLLRNLCSIVEDLIGTNGIASIVLLISRPGSAHMTVQDRRCAGLLHDAMASRYSNWPIHLATPGRIQAFAPDDLAVAG